MRNGWRYLEANLHLIGRRDSTHVSHTEGKGHVDVTNRGGRDRTIHTHPIGLNAAKGRAAITIDNVAIVASLLRSLQPITTRRGAKGITI